MQDHTCGCKVNAVHMDDRCKEHVLWGCHKDALPPGYGWINNGKECPPCFRAKVSSVGLSPAISQLTYERIKGHKPDKRGRENY